MDKKLRGKKTFFAKRRIIITAIMFFVTALIPSAAVFATDYSITMTTSGSVNITTQSNTAAIESSDINVITNCRAGYNLSLGTSVNDNNLYLDGDSSNNATNTYITPSNGTSALKDAPNTWGYFASFGASPIVPTENNIFNPVPTLANDPTILRTPAETASDSDIDDTFKVYYGANAGLGLTAGDYHMITDSTTNQAGGLTYYFTANPTCTINLDITFAQNAGEDTVTNFPTSSDNTLDSLNNTLTLSDKVPVRSGYVFTEWNTSSNGTGTAFAAGETITIGAGTGELSGDVTLYAIWELDPACPAGYICYHGNGADAGTMDNQSASSNTKTILIASNYSRAGYGFAGWSTVSDITDTTVTPYGPNATITTPDLSSEGLKLYAKWVRKSGNLQTWSSCSTMNTGDVIALRDVRDDEVYTVSKLADNNCWITENLRLVPSTTNISVLNTNNPTSAFITATPSSSSTTSQCAQDSAACDDQVYYYTGNMDRTKTQQPTGNDAQYAWYSYGSMYNWYTATAGNGIYTQTSGNVTGDICPAGWRLPTGDSSGEYTALSTALGGTSSTGAANLHAYPNNFINSGDYNPSSEIPDGRGTQGRIWSATPQNAAKSYRMGYNNTSISPSGTWNKWDNFAVRCIYQGGNIPYLDLTVDFEDAGISSVSFTNSNYGTVTATPANPTATIVDNVTYTITATPATGYRFSSWATDEYGTLGSNTTNPTTYIVTDEATLSVASTIIPTYATTVTLGEHITSVSFTNASYGTQTVTNNNGNQDGTDTGTVNLREGVEYTITATFANGYKLNAWTNGANSTIGSTSISPTTFTVTGASTLSVTATEADTTTYTLVYDAGSGTDAPASETATSQNATHDFTITNLAPIYYGYTFTGWTETLNSTTVDYTSGNTITVPSTGATTTKTLYAVYQQNTCPPGKICYYDNGADVNNGGRNTMSNQNVSSNSSANLIPSNYSRTGYGFAGWATSANATPYGPNATITTGDLSSQGLALYAKWVAPTGNLHDWNGCNSLQTGDVIALTDTRDNNVYTVAKLADNNCWTTENLRLVPSTATINTNNTHNPTSSFIPEAASSSSSTTMCKADSDTTCLNSVQFNANSLDRTLTPSYNTAASDVGWYSYGVYYNWYTATAGNGTYETTGNTTVNGDICPKKWHIPTGNNGEWVTLNNAANGSTSSDTGLRAYPVNLIWSGDYNNTKRTSGYSNGRMWSSTANANATAYRMGYASNTVTPNNSYNKWDGFAIRCVYDGDTVDYSDLIVTLPTGVESITFTNAVYGTETATTSSPTVSLAEGASYTITATFSTGYEFGAWTNGENSTLGNASENPTTIVITDDTTLTLTATEIPSYTVTVTMDTNTSSISFTNSIYPTQTATNSNVGTSSDTATVSLRRDASYTITATTATGYEFSSWSTTSGGTLGSTSTNPTTYTTTSNATLTVTSTPQSFTCTKQYRLQNANGTYPENYTADATESINYNGICSYTKSETNYTTQSSSETITSDTTISLDLPRTTYELTINKNDTYITSVTGANTYRWGESVSISATPASGSRFTSWSQTSGTTSTFADNTSASTTFTMPTSNATIYADGEVATQSSCFSSPMLSTVVSGITYMQDINSSNSATVLSAINTGDTYQIKDNRDNETYCVGKLADGNLWLLDNLALDLTNSTVLSGMNENNTHVSNTTLNYLKNGGGTTSDKYAITGVVNWTDSPTYASSNSYSDPLVNLTNKDVIPSDATSQAGQYKVGGYYNYCAATAGSYCYGNGTSYGTSSGNATEDICPKGWRMPTGNTTGEYRALYNNASYNTYANYRSALRLPLSGRFDAGSAFSQGSLGFFWSSTRGSDRYMYYLYLLTSNVLPSDLNTRLLGNSVRCVLDPAPTTETLTVSLDSNITSVSFTNANYPTQTVTTNGSTVNLYPNTSYTITATTATGYEFSSWSTTSGGTLGSTSTNPTSYTITAASTLTATSIQLQSMQSFTISDCNAMSNGDITRLYDTRDDTIYNISKLADGNCWLLDNLRLDLTDTNIVNNLTPQNTNANTDSLISLKNGNRNNGDQYATEGLKLVSEDWDETTGYSFSAPMVNTSHKNETATTFGAGSNKIGIYYNYCAASAGSYCWGIGQGTNGPNYESPSSDPNPNSFYDIDGDICPRGWKMPTGGATGEYGVLYSSYNNTASDVFNAFSAIHSHSIYYPQNDAGYFWSASWDSYSNNKVLITGGNSYYGLSSIARVDGASVRCLLDKSHPTTVNFSGTGISSVTFTDSLDNTQTANDGDTIKLKDGETYTVTANTLPGYELDSWSATSGTFGSTSTNPTTFTVTDTSTITVTGKAIPSYEVTVNFDKHVNSVAFYHATLGTQQVTNTGSTVSLRRGENYIVTASYANDYTTDTWTATAGTLSSNSTNPTTYTVINTATISLTSKSKTGSTTLLPGNTLNATMKTLAEGTSTSYSTSSSKIKALRMSNSLPAEFTPSTANTVSLYPNEKPIYIFFDNTNDAGIMYFYTEAKDIYMFEDSSMAFSYNTALTDISALSNWNTSNVTTMRGMFYGASSLTNIDGASSWNTSSVTDMSCMFQDASSLANINGASNWKTGGVTNMNNMFYLTSSLTNIDGASSWNTSSVTDMSNMFHYASALTNIDALSDWDTSSVTNMSDMFLYASALTSIDGASNWNTSNVTDMSSMFALTSSLTDASAINDWDIRAVEAKAGSFNYPDNKFRSMFYQSGGSPISAYHPEFTKRQGTWDANGTFIPNDATIPSSDAAYVTVSFGEHVRSVGFYNSTFGTSQATPTNPTVRIAKNTEYIITSSYDSGYDIASWSTTSTGTIGSINSRATTYTVTADATLSITAGTSSKLYMQDFTNEDCNGLNIGESLTLYDKRDEATYTTTRTGDGLCWMTSDLHLGSTSSSITLRNTDTDITASTFTLPKVETSSNKTQWGTTNSTTGLNTAHAYRYNSTKYLYNYYATTGGVTYSNLNPTTSICPKGWKLPTQAQANTYLSILGESDGSTNTEVITGSPLNFTSGLYDTNKTAYTNKAYWLANGWYNNYYYGYYFGIRTSSNVNYVQTSWGYQKMVGLGIRCVHASDKPTGFTINLDATGGTVNPRTLTGTTTQIMSNLPTPTREGSSFDGWYTQTEGGETISATNIRTGTSTYYAHWSASVPVNFDHGISSITISDGTNTQTISNSGDTVTLNPSIEYTITATSASGFQFSSWSVTGATLGDNNSSTTTFRVTGVATLSATSVVNQVDINYDGNGLYYNDDPADTTNQVSYLRSEGIKSVTRYSHTTNINDEGTANGTYANNLSTTDTVTIPGATSMNVTIYYDTESTSYDWVSVYQSPFNISNNNDATISTTTGNLSGKLAGRNSSRTSNYSTWHSQTYTITGDTVKFHFRSSSSSVFYGYYAIITANTTAEVLNPVSGTYATPSSATPYALLGWSEDRNATTPTYIDEQDIIENSTYSVSDSPVTLYAIYQAPKTVTVNLDSNVTSVSFMSNNYPAQTITESGEVELYSNSPYIISASFTNGYTLDTWSTTGGIIDSPTSLATTFTITGPATLSVTSKAPGSITSFTPETCSSLSVGDMVELTDLRDGSVYKVSKLADNNCWMLDNLRLNLTDSTVQSNLTSSTTNATNDTLSYLKGTKTGTASDKYPTTATTISSARSYSVPNINTTNKDTTSTVTYGKGSGKIGVYYNYCAASAGSYCYGNGTSTTGTPSSDPNTSTLMDVTEDICPAGWRMPTSGTNGEYQTLYNAYATASEGQVLGFKNALSTTLSGYFDNNSISSQGTYGNFWSSTYYNSSYMYRLYETSTAITPSSAGYRYQGYPVRCILGAPSFSTVTVNLDSNTDSITISNPTYGTITVTPDNNTVELRQGVEYTITANVASVAYDLSSWSISGGSTIGSTTTNPTTYTITGDSTLSVSTTEKPSYEVTVNIDEHVRSVAFYQDTLGVQQVTTSGNAVSLRRGVEYIMTATFEEDYSTGTWTTSENGTIGSTILPATTYTVTGPATLSLTSKSKTGSTTLLPGQQLNTKMKTLAEGRTTSYDTTSSKIKSLQMASALPADFVPSTDNTVSTTDSEQPIYIFFDNTNDVGIMYFYTEAKDIYMNTYSNSAFYRNAALADISALSNWNTGSVTDMSGMFNGASALTNIDALSSWNTGSVTNMSSMFQYAYALTDIDGASSWGTSKVNYMSWMFRGASALTNIDALSGWDTSSVTNMDHMFTDAYALTNIDGARNWNTGNVTDMSNMFAGAHALTNIDSTRNWNTGSVTNMSSMFQYAHALTNINGASSWDTGNVTSMSYMFDGASALTNIGGASNWDISIVFNMDSMFKNAHALTNIDGASNWDTSNVTNMSSMFQCAHALTNIDALSGWDTSSVTNMDYMFQYAYALTNIDGARNWDTSKVANMSYMFQYAYALTDIDGARNWNTSSVKDMRDMFYGATALTNIDALSSWNTGSVTNMSSMFQYAYALTDIDGASSWGTSKVNDMSWMFRGAFALTNIDALSGWDTSSVTNMDHMFADAYALTDIDGARNWNINKVVNFSDMFYNVPSHANFNKRFGTWNASNTFTPVATANTVTITINPDSHVKSITFSNSTYGARTITSGETISLAKNTEYTITAVYESGYTLDSWSSTSGTIGSTTSLSTTYQVSSDDTLSITSTPASTSTTTINIDSHVSNISFSNHYYDTVTLSNNNDTITLVNGLDYNIIINYENGYKDSSITTTSNGTIGNTTIKGITYTVTGNDTLAITTTEKTDTATLDTGSKLNAKMKTLAEGKNTENNTLSSKIRALKMTDFLPSDFTPSTTNTVSVASSEKPIYIFFDNTNDIGIMYFYTEAKDIYMNADSKSAFYNNTALADISALSNWNTGSVTDMSGMFNGASALTNIDGASSWDTSKVTNMGYMFGNARAITNIDGARNWNTGNVTDMSNMFAGAYALTKIDALRNWDTNRVTNMSYMFRYVYALTNIDGAKNWNTGSVTNISSMFQFASALTNIDGARNWDTSSVTDMSGMFNGATALTNIDGARNWNTSKATDTGYMFYGASALTNIDGASSWNTSSVTNMSSMFDSAYALTNIDGASSWDTSSVANMVYMFEDVYALTNIDGARNWDTSKATNMGYMFFNAYALANIDGARNWNTSSVTNMGSMFSGARALTNIDGARNWDTSKVTNMRYTFASATALTNLDGARNWDTGSVTDMREMFRSATALTDASAINNWDIRAVTATAGSSNESSNKFYRMFYSSYPDSHPEFTKRTGTWDNEGTFIPDGNTVPSSSSANVTVNFSAYVHSVSFYNATYGTAHVTSSGGTARLAKNTEYIITVTTDDGRRFTSWSTTESGTLGSTSENPTTYTVTGDTTLIANTAASEGGEGGGGDIEDDDIIVPDTEHIVTVNFSENTVVAEVSQVIFSDGTNNQIVTRSGETVSLEEGVAYTVVATFNEGFGFSSWSTASGGTLGSANSNPTTYTITGDTTITIISRDDHNPASVQSVVVSLGDNVTSISFSDGTTIQTITRENPVANLTLGTPYTITASFANGYELASWNTSTGTLGDATSNPTTYTIESAAFLTVNSKVAGSNSTNNTNNTNSPNSFSPTSVSDRAFAPASNETVANEHGNTNSASVNNNTDPSSTTTDPQGAFSENKANSQSDAELEEETAALILPTEAPANLGPALLIAAATSTIAGASFLAFNVAKKDDEEDDKVDD